MKKYAGHTSRKSVASSTMIWSGVVIAVFVLVHVKQFKYGAWYQTVSDNPIRDLARTEFEVFSHPYWVGSMLIATLIVGLHLRHGIASSFQSLGFDHPALYAAADDLGNRLRRHHRRRARMHSGVGLLDALSEFACRRTLDSKVPGGPLAEKWDRHRFESRLVNPANRRKYTIIIVGTGLAGASAASSLGELGYNVLSFCIQDSPATRAQHRRPGRYQRRQELSERRRQHPSALLRHGQGRRLSVA